MNIVSTNMTVVDFCDALARGDITVNKKYQRSEKVWPQVARSYLIETILLDYPIPKMYLYQITDLRRRKTTKEIVDGQQRSSTIRDFYNDSFALSVDNTDVRGRTFSQLDDVLQNKFLTFSLSFDLFVAATDDQVVEVFRRMNSYTVPLNDEEKRHASYQGKFKWFVNRIAQKFSTFFLDIGLYSEKQLVRMSDTKLLTEVCDAFVHGIRTTNKKSLDELYKSRDKDFAEEGNFEGRLTEAFDHVRDWTAVLGGNLMKPYIMYALVLAVTHVRRRVDTLQGLFVSPRLRQFNLEQVVPNLLALSDALENPDDASPYSDFVEACTSKTNTREQRTRRFLWMCRALTSDLSA
jgi:hypothetical protein